MVLYHVCQHQDSCYLLWWFILVRRVPDKLKEGAIPNTLFANSESGWIYSQLFVEWFAFFIKNIPPATPPVILVQDGCRSHVSIELRQLVPMM